MRDSVDEVGRVAAEERLEVDFAKGGTITLARSRAQLRCARAEVDAARAWGRGEDEVRLLGRRRGPLGSSTRPGCAVRRTPRTARRSIPPGWSAGWPGWSRTRRGGTRLRAHPGDRDREGPVRTDRGDVRAGVVLRATEGYTPHLPGAGRAVVPVYSLVIATEPLPERVWDEIGLRHRETFTDHRNLIVYGQRTADGRLVFGGRGAPYHFGSRTDAAFDRDPRVVRGAVGDAARDVPGARGPQGHARVGRSARRAPRLVRLRRAGRRHRARLGGRLRRRRREYDEPGRPHAARPGARPSHRPDRPAVGAARLAPLGARAAALDRGQRRPADDDAGRRRGAGHRPAEPAGAGDGALVGGH